MTHKPAVGIGGFGRDKTSELSNRSPFIASAAPSSSPTSETPPPLPRLAADGYLTARELPRLAASPTLHFGGEPSDRGAKKARKQFQEKALEAIHSAASEQEHDAGGGA
jgi:hypothetical protein